MAPLKSCFALACAVIVLGALGCAGMSAAPDAGRQAQLPLADIDMARMYGGWYLIATLPNAFERGMVGPYDVYSRRPDGDIREDFYVRRGGFAAPLNHFVIHDWVSPGTHNAHWRVQIVWPVNLPFLVVYTDPSYRYALFGEENRKLGWIYARAPLIPDADYRALLMRFQALGYDPRRFRKFVQTPDQIGQPGVWSDGVKSESPARRAGIL